MVNASQAHHTDVDLTAFQQASSGQGRIKKIDSRVFTGELTTFGEVKGIVSGNRIVFMG